MAIHRRRVWAVSGCLPLVDHDGATLHSTPIRYCGRLKPAFDAQGEPIGDPRGEIGPEGELVPWPGPGHYYARAVRDGAITDIDPRASAKAGE